MSRGSTGLPSPAGVTVGQINVFTYGARGDGITDDTAAIQAAIDATESSSGGTVFFPPGTYLLSTTLVVNRKNVTLLGAGADTGHDVGTSLEPGSQLKWIGASGGTMLRVTAVEGASGERITRCSVQGVSLNGDKIAGIGLQVLSAHQCVVEDVTLGFFTEAALDIDSVDTLGEARDTQHCRFTGLNFRQHTTVPEGIPIRIRGEATYNTSFNYFENINVIHKDAVALDIGGSDNNVFVMFRANRASGGTGGGVLNRAGATSGEAATSNYFIHLSPGPGGVTFEGTAVAASPSTGQIFFYDQGNGAPLPVIGTGCKVQYWVEKGWLRHPGFTRAVIADSSTNVEAEMLNVDTESLRIINGASNHIRILDTAANRWGIRMSGGGLLVERQAGTGFFVIPSTATQFGSGNTISAGANDSAGAGFRVLRIPNT